MYRIEREEHDNGIYRWKWKTVREDGSLVFRHQTREEARETLRKLNAKEA